MLFSVAAGLPVGKEGPMIHSGSAIAASLTAAPLARSAPGRAWAYDAEVHTTPYVMTVWRVRIDRLSSQRASPP